MPKLTKTIIDNLAAPDKGEVTVWDSELPGFGVRMQSGGRKVYVVRYRPKNGTAGDRRLTLGRCSDMPPDKARGLARDVFTSVAAGNDPAAERKKQRFADDVTVEALFKARIAAMREKERAMADNVEHMLLTGSKNAADALGRKKHPSQITPDDIVRYVSTFYQAGHRGAADKARAYLAATFSWAIKSANDYTVAQRKDWGVTINPAAAVAKDQGATAARNRNLSAEEMREFWHACTDGNAGFTESMEVALKMVMACGQRVQETLRLDGAEVDLDAALWTMPAHKTKGKKAIHIIPLPACIIADLRRLKDKHGDGPLFPSRNESSVSGILGHLAVAHAVRRYSTGADAPMPAFQPRDLRRTWKSRAHNAGVDRFTRDLIQQHAKNDTGSKHYDMADYLPQMTEAMQKWSDWLMVNVISPPPQPQLLAA